MKRRKQYRSDLDRLKQRNESLPANPETKPKPKPLSLRSGDTLTVEHTLTVGESGAETIVPLKYLDLDAIFIKDAPLSPFFQSMTSAVQSMALTVKDFTRAMDRMGRMLRGKEGHDADPDLDDVNWVHDERTR